MPGLGSVRAAELSKGVYYLRTLALIQYNTRVGKSKEKYYEFSKKFTLFIGKEGREFGIEQLLGTIKAVAGGNKVADKAGGEIEEPAAKAKHLKAEDEGCQRCVGCAAENGNHTHCSGKSGVETKHSTHCAAESCANEERGNHFAALIAAADGDGSKEDLPDKGHGIGIAAQGSGDNTHACPVIVLIPHKDG